MNTKLLVFLTWLFYLALLNTADEVWKFCSIYGLVLTICSFFYHRENKSNSFKKKKSG